MQPPLARTILTRTYHLSLPRADPHEQQQRQLVQRIVRSVGRLNEVVQNLNSEMEVRAPHTRSLVRVRDIKKHAQSQT